MRLDASGNPDSSFGDDGLVTVPISRSRQFFDDTYGVQVMESRDDLRVATPIYRRHESSGPRSIAVVALRDDGRLRRRYGKNGIAVIRTK